MKKFYTTLVLATMTLIAFSQSYSVFTAKGNGLWYDTNNWAIAPRVDGVTKNKVIIPTGFSITADNNVNGLIPGDVEVIVQGVLRMHPNTTLNLTNNSTIQLSGGSINGNTANQQINLGGVLKYKGDIDGVKTGSSIADNTTGVSPNGFRSLTTLPVNFTSFYVSKTDNNVQLTWSTDQETDNSHFDVERSFNGTEWQKISVVPGRRISNNSNTYNYNDKGLSKSVVYYRLRQVDIDGRFIYSSIKTLRVGESVPAIKIYGFEKTVVLDLNTAINNDLLITVVSANGEIVYSRLLNKPSYKITLDLCFARNGAYVIRATDNKGLLQVQKVIL